MTNEQKELQIRKVITVLTFCAIPLIVFGFIAKVISSFYNYPLRIEAVSQIFGGTGAVLLIAAVFISSVGIHLRGNTFEKKLKGLYSLFVVLLFGFPFSYVLIRGIVELITGQPVPVPIINIPIP
jgi:hypothetical protein